MPQTAVDQSLSRSGTFVRSRRDAGLVGESIGRTRDDGYGLMVQVRFPGQLPRFERAEGLKPANTKIDERQKMLAGEFASASHLSQRLASVRARQLLKTIYSLDTTIARFTLLQFRVAYGPEPKRRRQPKHHAQCNVGSGDAESVLR